MVPYRWSYCSAAMARICSLLHINARTSNVFLLRRPTRRRSSLSFFRWLLSFAPILCRFDLFFRQVSRSILRSTVSFSTFIFFAARSKQRNEEAGRTWDTLSQVERYSVLGERTNPIRRKSLFLRCSSDLYGGSRR